MIWRVTSPFAALAGNLRQAVTLRAYKTRDGVSTGESKIDGSDEFVAKYQEVASNLKVGLINTSSRPDLGIPS